MRILNPATNAPIATVKHDTAATVRNKYRAARAAQGKWAQLPCEQRIDVIRRFRDRIVARREDLARTLTSEVGKPLTQARNELNGVLGRIDFFIEHAAAVLGDKIVLADGAARLEEKISHEPLGVIANISAWNYPYFVGTNVFVPALIAGNSVLYKPSEFATLTGIHIARLLHEAGVPEDVFVPLVGGGAVGVALLAQDVDGVFVTGSHATGAKIAQTVGSRFIRLQLEL